MTDRLILALDVPSADAAKRLLDQVRQDITFVKIGLELFTREGPAVVRWAVKQGLQVFLDLKLHDIVETVKGATAAAADLGVTFMTVHTGTKILKAALEGRGPSPMKILAVTVLTTFTQEDLFETGVGDDLATAVLRRGRVALWAGADGLIVPAACLPIVRVVLGNLKPLLVTPGVAVGNFATTTADYFVVGRAIRDATDPLAAVRAIQAEIAQVTA